MIAALLAALAASSGPSALPEPSLRQQAETRRALTRFISVRDYPREALRRRAEGRVEFEVETTGEGRVSDCRILYSSGHALLDERTCAIMRERARIAPRRDAQGRPVSGRVRTAYNWIMPGARLTPVDSRAYGPRRVVARGYDPSLR
ncbi:MAG: TonB family protein [Alphaproteobacteria bacterium]|nr:MAG: TonB family protein [Alphaproteobacteria bacterium]